MIVDPAPIAQPHRPVRGQTPARRRDRVRGLVTRLRDRRAGGVPSLKPSREAPARRFRPYVRRKTALALSAGAMGLGSAAFTIPERSSPIVLADDTQSRRPAGQLAASDAFREALIEEEGVRRTVYLDAAGQPTVGVGHLVTPVDGLRVGEEVGYDRILDLFERDLGAAEQAVVRLVGSLPLFQHEFDALVDLVYNVGEGGVSQARSPRLNAAIASGDYGAIAAELAYHQAAGGEAAGLVLRSERRTNMFAEASYADPRQVDRARGTA